MAEGHARPAKTAANSGQFKPGAPRPAGSGRKPGSPNKATLEAREACRALVDSPAYRARLAERLEAGTLAPAVECMLWHYAHGKPVERVEHSGTIGLETLAEDLAGAVERAEAVEELQQ